MSNTHRKIIEQSIKEANADQRTVMEAVSERSESSATLQNLIEQKEEELKKKFDNKFYYRDSGEYAQMQPELNLNQITWIKQFIIEQQRQSLTEIAQATIEGVKPERIVGNDYNQDDFDFAEDGYNQAISDMEQKAKTYLGGGGMKEEKVFTVIEKLEDDEQLSKVVDKYRDWLLGGETNQWEIEPKPNGDIILRRW